MTDQDNVSVFLHDEIKRSEPIVLHKFMSWCFQELLNGNDLPQQDLSLCHQALDFKERWMQSLANRKEIWAMQHHARELFQHYNAAHHWHHVAKSRYAALLCHSFCSTAQSKTIINKAFDLSRGVLAKNIAHVTILYVDALKRWSLRYSYYAKHEEARKAFALEHQRVSCKLRDMRKKQQELETTAANFSTTLMEGMFR